MEMEIAARHTRIRILKVAVSAIVAAVTVAVTPQVINYVQEQRGSSAMGGEFLLPFLSCFLIKGMAILIDIWTRYLDKKDLEKMQIKN